MEQHIYRKKKNTAIENHQTAAWSEIHSLLSQSKVTIPSLDNVELAKDWVEENQK